MYLLRIRCKFRRPHALQEIGDLLWCIHNEIRDDFNRAYRQDYGGDDSHIDREAREALACGVAFPFALYNIGDRGGARVTHARNTFLTTWVSTSPTIIMPMMERIIAHTKS